MFNKRIKSTTRIIANLGLGATAMMSFIADFLKPVAPFSLYLLVGVIITITVSMFARSIPSLNRSISEKMPDIWYAPLFVTLLISSGVLLVSYKMGEESGSGGFLANKFPVIENIQSSLGIINRNLERLNVAAEKIEENTLDTAVSAGSIDRKIDELIVSSDPRKELSNLGIPWSVESLAHAIRQSDIRTIELFKQGGFSPIQASDEVGYRLSPFWELFYNGYKPMRTLEYLFSKDDGEIYPNDYDFIFQAIFKRDENAIAKLIDYGADYNFSKTGKFLAPNGEEYSFNSATPACFVNFMDELRIFVDNRESSKMKSVGQLLGSYDAVSEGVIKYRPSTAPLCSFEMRCPAIKKSWGCVKP